ncbi:hypothetical protein RN001_000397 [Aquatica leii]|uniref:Uncharacterized protein n=1 Tax=Aquatica leii TaxID=1421715 RepID=A0AAN7PK28_9COLE|nr:hypothetical protein RN001_000397 [Aquatica leii]
MGLLVDKPKPGYGSTNDGNTARKFFSNPFFIILRMLSSGFTIDDLMTILILTSEPLISNQRNITTKKGMKIDGKVEKYIKVLEPSISNNLISDLALIFGEESFESD